MRQGERFSDGLVTGRAAMIPAALFCCATSKRFYAPLCFVVSIR